MPPTPSVRIPSYRMHKPTGLAVVRLNGRDFYLGRHGSDSSKVSYERLIAEWLAGNRTQTNKPPETQATSPTVDELIGDYINEAQTLYVKHGKPTSTIHSVKAALRPLSTFYGPTLAKDFGPLALKAVRNAMMETSWTRRTINKHIGIIKAMFKSVVANERLSPVIYQGLQAVSPLKRGRCEARESEPVKPVPQAHIDAVLPHVNGRVAAMIRLQLLIGMRPGEVVLMRGRDLDTTGRIWTFKPAYHKTEHRGRQCLIYLGPQAQAILKPWLKAELSSYLFSPHEAMEAWHRQRRTDRKTPMTPSQSQRQRRRNPKWISGDRNTTGSYERVITVACRCAFPPPEHLRRRELPNGRRETEVALQSRLNANEKAELKSWHRQHRWSPIVREYAVAHLSAEKADDITAAVFMMEELLGIGMKETPEGPRFEYWRPPVRAEECRELVKRLDAQLHDSVRHSWRWRILLLRAVLDAELKQSGGKPTLTAAACWRELIDLYHAHHAVGACHPPIVDGKASGTTNGIINEADEPAPEDDR